MDERKCVMCVSVRVINFILLCGKSCTWWHGLSPHKLPSGSTRSLSLAAVTSRCQAWLAMIVDLRLQAGIVLGQTPTAVGMTTLRFEISCVHKWTWSRGQITKSPLLQNVDFRRLFSEVPTTFGHETKFGHGAPNIVCVRKWKGD